MSFLTRIDPGMAAVTNPAEIQALVPTTGPIENLLLLTGILGKAGQLGLRAASSKSLLRRSTDHGPSHPYLPPLITDAEWASWAELTKAVEKYHKGLRRAGQYLTGGKGQ